MMKTFYSLFAALLAFAALSFADNAPITVTNANDAGAGSLRAALAAAAAAPGADTIVFDAALNGQTIALSTFTTVSGANSAFNITDTGGVTVDATALPAGVKIDGGSQGFRIFTVNTGGSLTLHGLTLANGGGASFTDDGGAILNFSTLTLTRCTLTGNFANDGDGGAISNDEGTLILTQCTLSGNTSDVSSGGGGAIYNHQGAASLTQCTLSGNLADGLHGGGGAIRNDDAVLALIHCTLSGNSARNNGGGVLHESGASTLTLHNTIIAGNKITGAGTGADIYNDATLTRDGGNLVQVLVNGGGNVNGGGTISTSPPQLAALADNGGPTQTRALLANSPARNAAAVLDPAITSDQRGSSIAGLPDIGAYEFPNSPPIAMDSAITATTGDQKTFSVSASDEDGIPPTIISTTPDSHLTVNSTSGLAVTFTPATNFTGDATLGYTVSDGNGGTASGTITVTITDNDAPSISGTFSPRIVFAGTMPDFRAQAVKSDNVGTPTVTQSPPQGSATTVGTVDVTLTATDGAGLTAATGFNLTVRPLAPIHTTHAIIAGANTPLAPGAGTNGLPADAKLTSFGPPATSDAGDVAFIGKWKSATSKGTGLFVNDTCLAIVGGDAPIAGAKYVRFTDPVVEGGKVVCIAKLTTGASAVVSNFSGAALEKIALTGEVTAAGDPKFKAFKSVAISNRANGTIAIFAQLSLGTGTPKTTAASDLGLWTFENDTLTPALREGGMVGGKTIKTLVSFLPGAGSPGQGRGWLGNDGDAEVLALAFFTDKTQGVVLKNTDESNPIILSAAGATAAGAPDITGATFATYSLPARNDDRTTAFTAAMKVGAGGVTKANARGIFLNPANTGKFTPLARLGQPAGVNSANFSKLSDPVLSPDSSVAFTATLKGGTAKGLLAKTLWWKPANQPLALLAQGSVTTVGDLPDAQWKSFDSLAITDRSPIFAATLVAGKGGVTAATASGVWACDFAGNPRKLFRVGDTINGKKLAKFTLLKATVGNAGVTRSFNNTAQVVWLAAFTDKSTAIIVTEVP